MDSLNLELNIMEELNQAWIMLKLGGIIIIPLVLLGVIAVAIMLEKAFIYWRYARLSSDLLNLVETYGFKWNDLEKILSGLDSRHYYKRFFEVVISNRHQPAWWTESRAADEAQIIEESLARRLWALVLGAVQIGTSALPRSARRPRARGLWLSSAASPIAPCGARAPDHRGVFRSLPAVIYPGRRYPPGRREAVWSLLRLA